MIAEAVRAALNAFGLELFCDDSILSNALTAFKVAQDVKDSQVRETMAHKSDGIMISGGLERLKRKIMRIRHMGETAKPQ